MTVPCDMKPARSDNMLSSGLELRKMRAEGSGNMNEPSTANAWDTSRDGALYLSNGAGPHVTNNRTAWRSTNISERRYRRLCDAGS